MTRYVSNACFTFTNINKKDGEMYPTKEREVVARGSIKDVIARVIGTRPEFEHCDVDVHPRPVGSRGWQFVIRVTRRFDVPLSKAQMELFGRLMMEEVRKYIEVYVKPFLSWTAVQLEERLPRRGVYEWLIGESKNPPVPVVA